MRGKISAVHVRNFKAVADSQWLRLSPLTVFVGNNGSGKSSVIEALHTLQRLVTVGVDRAMQVFKGIEHLRHKAVKERAAMFAGTGEDLARHAIEVILRGKVEIGIPGHESQFSFRSQTRLNATASNDRYFVEVDDTRLSEERVTTPKSIDVDHSRSEAKELRRKLGGFIKSWQFLALDPACMGNPVLSRHTAGPLLMEPDGANLADYIRHLVMDHDEKGRAAWQGIVEALHFVLPYATDVQPHQAMEIDRRSYFSLVEHFGPKGARRFDVPGWMLSTGTTRVLAFLAVFRHPNPPPLICIEEVENGLDPRTLRLVVNEIRSLVESGKSQVIVTTHSPYLLDLLPLPAIVMTERTKKGVTFTRPIDQKSVTKWAREFAPGQLYMMGRFRSQSSEE